MSHLDRLAAEARALMGPCPAWLRSAWRSLANGRLR